MKAAALAVVLGLAVPAAAWASPQQPPDGIVTLKRKASTWSFKITPEGRKKAIVEDKEVEVDVPQRIYVAWAVDEPYLPLRGANPFTSSVNSNSATVSLFREGK